MSLTYTVISSSNTFMMPVGTNFIIGKLMTDKGGIFLIEKPGTYNQKFGNINIYSRTPYPLENGTFNLCYFKNMYETTCSGQITVSIDTTKLPKSVTLTSCTDPLDPNCASSEANREWTRVSPLGSSAGIL